MLGKRKAPFNNDASVRFLSLKDACFLGLNWDEDALQDHKQWSSRGQLCRAFLVKNDSFSGLKHQKIKSIGGHALAFARSCWGHLAGTLGVRLYDAIKQLRWIEVKHDRHILLTKEGATNLSELGVSLKSQRLALCRDHTEMQAHLSGPLAASILKTFVQQGWIHTQTKNRSLKVTDLGQHMLTEKLGMNVSQ
jgi:hypothetical protein